MLKVDLEHKCIYILQILKLHKGQIKAFIYGIMSLILPNLLIQCVAPEAKIQKLQETGEMPKHVFERSSLRSRNTREDSKCMTE